MYDCCHIIMCNIHAWAVFKELKLHQCGHYCFILILLFSGAQWKNAIHFDSFVNVCFITIAIDNSLYYNLCYSFTINAVSTRKVAECFSFL